MPHNLQDRLFCFLFKGPVSSVKLSEVWLRADPRVDPERWREPGACFAPPTSTKIF